VATQLAAPVDEQQSLGQRQRQITSPIRQMAQRRKEQQVREELWAELAAQSTETVPMRCMQPVFPEQAGGREQLPMAVQRDLLPCAYVSHPDLSPAMQIETVIERYRLEHGGAAPTAISIDPTTLLRYFMQVAPGLFVFKTANGKQVVSIEAGPELPQRMMMCYRQIS
jgi:hypothetical protein